MQGKQLFEYAVIRVVPRVEREEFLNVGVVLYCAGEKFLDCRWQLDEARLSVFSPETDIDEVKNNLRSFSEITKGSEAGGPIGKLDNASRFRWLTATRSTVIQTSKVHPGFCENSAETLDRLFSELVSL